MSAQIGTPITKDLKARDRVRFVRLLKPRSGNSKTSRSINRTARATKSKIVEAVSGSRSQSNARKSLHGRVAKLDQEQQARFVERLKQDDISTLEQARAFLQQECGVSTRLAESVFCVAG
jgi:hypothetical protein